MRVTSFLGVPSSKAVYDVSMQQQRSKKWAPKTRSGCGTCRRRRVKCDEARPICHACNRLDLSCRYTRGPPSKLYRPKDSSPTITNAAGHPVASIRTLNISLGSSEETVYLNLYQKVTAPWLSTYSQPAFFEEVLPIWACHHHAIKHALVALSMASEEHYLENRVTRQHRRVWHYDQALKHMYASNEPSNDVIMLACVVLWLHDNIIQDTHPAVVHIKGFVQMLLMYEKQRTPANVGKNLECTIWRGISHWGQRAQSCFETRLSMDAIATVRKKLKDTRFDRQVRTKGSCTADALLYVTAVIWACDEHSDDGCQSSQITFEELKAFLDQWYATVLVEEVLTMDDLIVLQCHHTIMALLIWSQEQTCIYGSADLLEDIEALRLFENMLALLESISLDSLTQKPGKRDLILPIIPVALEAERLAPTMPHKARIRAVLGRVKRVESFWGTDVVADLFTTTSIH